MGMYDEFTGICPYCGKDYYGQTKLFSDDMREITIGTKVDNVTDMRLECKMPCCHCWKKIVAVFEKGVLQKFAKLEEVKPNFKEEIYGTLINLENGEIHD